MIRARLAMTLDHDCPCTMTACEWHGQCYECVRIHRCYGDRLPACLQVLLPAMGWVRRGKAKQAAGQGANVITAYWAAMAEKHGLRIRKPRSRPAATRRRAPRRRLTA